MIGVIVTIGPTDELTRERASAVAEQEGPKFEGMDGLRKVLLSRPEEFVLTMSGQLLTYSLGRSLEYYDAPVLRAIVRDARSHEYRFSTLVTGIVNSMPFQMRRAQS